MNGQLKIPILYYCYIVFYNDVFSPIYTIWRMGALTT